MTKVSKELIEFKKLFGDYEIETYSDEQIEKLDLDYYQTVILIKR